MKKIIIIGILLITVFTLFVTGCQPIDAGETTSSVVIFDNEVASRDKFGNLNFTTNNILILFIDGSQSKVKEQINETLASDEYEIFAIKTVYAGKSIVAAEIYYKNKR